MDKRERRGFFVVTLIYAVLLVSLIYALILRDLSTIQGVYILNIGMDIAGLGVGYLLFVSCMVDRHRVVLDRQVFLMLLFGMCIGLLSDIIAWLVDGLPSLWLVNLLDNTVYYMCSPIQAFLFWKYIQTFVHLNRPLEKILDKAVRYGLWAAIAMRIINLFTGFYFTVDESGVYHRSPTYMVSMVYASFTLIASLIVIGQERKVLRRNQVIILLSYVMVPLAATVVTAGIYGLSVSPVMLMGEVLLMYCVLNVQKSREQAVADRDLKMATRIQANMLPNIFPAFSERSDFDVYASMTPAREVGGDFYDFFLIDDDHLGMVVADVSGKGVPAALFMMASMILVNNTTRMEGAGASPGAVLAMVNDAICSNNSEEMFVTVWLGIMTISTGKVIAANAGHEYPMVMGADGKFTVMKDPHGLVIGALEEMCYTDYEFTLEKGGTLFVYTDGVTEAANAGYELFGTERMLDSLNEAAGSTPKELLDYMKESVDRFVGDAPQFDDMTMMAVTRY